MAEHETLLQLPFETAPQLEYYIVGDETTGTLKFPVYNDLTITEAAWMSAHGAKDTAFKYTSKLALKICRAENVKPLDAHHFVSKVMVAAMGGEVDFDHKEMDWQVIYIKDLEEVAFKVLEVSVANQQQLVTCLIKHRLPGMQDWKAENTAQLPSHLCEAIYAFALKEQGRGKEPDQTTEEAQREAEELLGKSPTEAGNPPSQSTGEKPSTSSESSSPAPKSSPRKRSASSKPATSSKSSEKAAD